MAKVTADTLWSVRAKATCCRSSTRCGRCPVVLHKLREAHADELSRKKFDKAFKRARRR